MSRNGDETTLYRLFDEGGSLLYVGISGNWSARMGQHATDKSWWQDVANIKRETFPSRAEALAAEAQVIYGEQPLHNVNGRRSPPQPKAKAPTPLSAEFFELTNAMTAARGGAACPPLSAFDDRTDFDAKLAALDATDALYEETRAYYLQAMAWRERIFFLLHQSGWTPTEIAERFDISPTRVRQVLEVAS